MAAKLSPRVKHLLLGDRFLKAIGLKKSNFIRKRLCLMDDPIPVDPKTVYFDSYYGAKVDCNPLAVFRSFAQRFEDGTFRYVWVLEPSAPVPDDVVENPDTVFVQFKSLQNQIELRRAKYIVQNNNLPADFAAQSDQIILNTWHGIPIKTLGANFFQDIGSLYNVHRSFNVSDIILSSGDYYTKQAIHSNEAPIDENAIHTIGFPRLDGLASAAKRTPLVANTKPILLYAPTWRGTLGKIDKEVEEQIKVCHLLADEFGSKYDIYANLHHLAHDKVDLSQHSVKTVPNNVDMNRFLETVDLLITDYSSIILDFLVLDRPGILYAHDLDTYRVERGLAAELEELPFAVVHKPEDLIAAIRTAQRPSTFENFSHARAKFLGPISANASEQAIDLMMNFERQETQRTKHRVLLFGGSFQQNGITTSLINLTKMIDYERIELFIVVHPPDLDGNPKQRDLFERLDPRVRILLWRRGRLPINERLRLSGKRAPRIWTNRDKIISRMLERFSVIAKRHWRDITFDATVVFTGYAASTSLLALSTNSRRKAIFLHNDIASEIETKGNISWIIPEIYRRFDKIVSVSPALMEINGGNLRSFIPAQQEAYCHNSLDHLELQDRAEEKCVIADDMNDLKKQNKDAQIYVHVGRFSHEKNHRLLLEAFSEILKTRPQSHLWLIGNGPIFDEIVAYSKELNLQGNVHFTGLIDNPAPALKAADAFVLSSVYEGQPMVLLEAMTLGLRCVAVESPQVRYVLKNGLGTIVPATQAGLARGMIEVANGKAAPKPFDPYAYNEIALKDFYDVIGLPE